MNPHKLVVWWTTESWTVLKERLWSTGRATKMSVCRAQFPCCWDSLLRGNDWHVGTQNVSRSVPGPIEKTTQNLAERRAAREINAIRQPLEHGMVYTNLVNSDQQMADGIKKPQAAGKLLEIMSAGRWKIVWDPTFQNARRSTCQNSPKSNRVWRILDDKFCAKCCLQTKSYPWRTMMISHESYPGCVVSISIISWDVSIYKVHD